ncbi:MAG: HAD family phosphatase [Agathobacter sp.]|nr:HAD family phosphatase [Agathobacter sp.]
MKLAALDLDGTLFNNNSQISEGNLSAIRRITEAGVHAVISTGRPFAGIPFAQLKNTGIDYAITTNGAAIYRISTGECLCEEPLDDETVFPILDFLLSKDIHMDAFIGGKGYSPRQCLTVGKRLNVPDELKKYIVETRIRVDDLPGFIREKQLRVQKMTLNFYQDTDGNYVDREEVRQFLEGNPAISCVCGGFHNLEFTRADVNKGRGLHTLSRILGIDPADTMAIGDTENDIAVLKAAGIAVAMGNATDAVKAQADYITDTNERDGVARALMHFLPELYCSHRI